MGYAKDENGDALRQMEAQGDDLSQPRNIDFTVVFPEGSLLNVWARSSVSEDMTFM